MEPDRRQRCAPISAWGWRLGSAYAVSDRPLRDSPLFTGARAMLAMASVLALMVTGVMLEATSADSAEIDRADGAGHGERNSAARGRHGFRADALRRKQRDVHGGAQGTLGARYTDPETGNVTMTKVYVE